MCFPNLPHIIVPLHFVLWLSSLRTIFFYIYCLYCFVVMLRAWATPIHFLILVVRRQTRFCFLTTLLVLSILPIIIVCT